MTMPMPDDPPALRKPRIALMGEFSAGKSTLANLLVGSRHLPMQVTATQLPPVWISHGAAAPFRVDLDGKSIPVSLTRLADVPIAETAFIRIFQQSPTLEVSDIIDMPGISDPNMPAEIWQRLLPEADAVIWCTHATQAWRQSESAIWATMPSEMQRRSLLLLTRIDKIVGDRDRHRIAKRVDRETDGLFARGCLPISLTNALAGRDDPALWTSSGAADFMAALHDVVEGIAQASSPVEPSGSIRHFAPSTSKPPDTSAPIATVLPRRIRSESGLIGATPRPAHLPDDPQLAAFRAMARRGRE